MAERAIMKGNEALAEAALRAGAVFSADTRSRLRQKYLNISRGECMR